MCWFVGQSPSRHTHTGVTSGTVRNNRKWTGLPSSTTDGQLDHIAGQQIITHFAVFPSYIISFNTVTIYFIDRCSGFPHTEKKKNWLDFVRFCRMFAHARTFQSIHITNIQYIYVCVCVSFHLTRSCVWAFWQPWLIIKCMSICCSFPRTVTLCWKQKRKETEKWMNVVVCQFVADGKTKAPPPVFRHFPTGVAFPGGPLKGTHPHKKKK